MSPDLDRRKLLETAGIAAVGLGVAAGLRPGDAARDPVEEHDVEDPSA
jgi:hypothetical protein